MASLSVRVTKMQSGRGVGSKNNIISHIFILQVQRLWDDFMMVKCPLPNPRASAGSLISFPSPALATLARCKRKGSFDDAEAINLGWMAEG